MKYACILIMALGVLLPGCSMNREAVKRSYLDNGNRLFEKGNLEDASINYRKAIQKDGKFGEAYYRLGVCESRRSNLREAYRALTRAVELLPDHDEVKVALADTSLALYLHDGLRPAHEEAIRIVNALRQQDSFDALRLKGYIAMADKRAKDAIDYLRRANEITPMQPDLVLAYTQALFQGEAAQVSEGETLARRLVAAHPEFRSIYSVLYGRYMATNRGAAAEKILEEKVQNNPTDADSLIELAGHYARKGDRQAVNATIDRMLRNPEFADRYLRAGDFYRSQNQLDRALAIYEQGRAVKPQQELTYDIRSIEILKLQGKGDEALGRIEKLLKRSRDNDELILLKATLLIERGAKPQLEEAAGMLQGLLKREDKPQYHNQLGEAYLRLGEADHADIEFTTAAATPGYLEPGRALARLSMQKNDYRRALQYAEAVLAMNPNDPGMRLVRAAALRGQGNFNLANAELGRLRREFPNAFEPRLELGVLRVAEGKLKDAETMFQTASPAPPDLRAIKALAQTYLLDNQPGKALKLIGDQIQAQPEHAPELHVMLADAAMAADQLGLAVEEFGQAAELLPKSSYVHLRWGDALLQKGEVNEAIRHLRIAHDASPGDPEALAMLGLAYDRAGQVNEAMQAYSEVLKLQSTNAGVLNNLAYAMANNGGDLDQALQMAQEAQHRAPKDPGIEDTVGWIYLKKHMVDAALHSFTNNVRVAPENPVCRYHLALALVEKGDRAAAKTHLEAALSNGPTKSDEVAIRALLATLP